MPQCIPDENDREFTTGSGHWAGVFDWHGDTYKGRQGYITIPITAGSPQETVTLDYPNVKPPASNRIGGALYSQYQATPGYHPVPDAYLTDGNYSYQYGYGGIIGEWEVYYLSQELPEDWNEAAAQITVTPQTQPVVTGSIYLDGFTMTSTPLAVPKIDHLPLMGVH